MRNPNWHRDEVILALDLYFSEDRGSIDDRNKKIIELSKTLNNLPLFPHRPDAEKFRNANGVTLKLTNFLAFDKSYSGKGMVGGSKLDKKVFQEFYHDRQRLRRIAAEIRKITNDEKLRENLRIIDQDEIEKIDMVIEGQTIYRLHKYKERDFKIVRAKKEYALNELGKLACEACVFEFEKYYGVIGKGFIECHHRIPLSSIQVETSTKLEDLALVCSNCHRMLHKRIDTITIEDLRMMIKYERV